jgi:hypothetical protein
MNENVLYMYRFNEQTQHQLEPQAGLFNDF